MKFEWDESKNRLNKIKHGISFEVASRVFADQRRIERYDAGHSDVEERWVTIGMVYPRILVVIYTERQANEKEQWAYYQV